MPRPSENAMRSVGQEVVWERFEPRPRRVEGVVIDVQFMGSTVTTEDGTYPGIAFLIKPKKGRAVWTDTFADTGSELPEDIGPA